MGALLNWSVEEAAARNYYTLASFLKHAREAEIIEPAVAGSDARRTIPDIKLKAFEREGILQKNSPPSQPDLFTKTEVAALLNVKIQKSDGWIDSDEIIMDDFGRCCISRDSVLRMMEKHPPELNSLNDNPSYVFKNRELLHRLYGDVAIAVSHARVLDTASTLSELDERLDSLAPDDVPYLVSLAPAPLMTR